MNNRKPLLLLSMIFIGGFTWGQVIPGIDDEVDTPDMDQMTAMALADSTYPVTPGDQYILSFSFRGQIQDVPISVTTDYRLDLGIFGSVEAGGLTFPELKNLAEQTVNGFYPGSHPKLTIESIGEFQVSIFMEGKGPVSINASGLTRLGDIIDNLVPDDEYSQRKIQITNRTGESSYYDYYRYLYRHEEPSNPHLQPGQRVQFSYSDLVVEITGAVREPKTVSIIARDTMDSIISYVGGFTRDADRSRIQKWQIVDGEQEYSLHEWGDRELLTARSNELRINVPTRGETRRVMTVEINTPAIESDDDDVTMYDEVQGESVTGEYIRLTIPVFEGMLVSDVLEEVEPYFTHMTDLRFSSIVREGEEEPLHVNLEDVLNTSGSPYNVEVKPNDVLGIPARMVFVSVSGGVYVPGRYYYTPMRTADYYITMAGGIDPEQNSHRNVVVYDETGNQKDRKALIKPGDNIVVVQDNMVFQFNEKFAAVTVGLTFITTLTLLITTLAGGL